VALVDRGDFGAATSANSLKVIHGGLRYLQHADLARVRSSALELALLRRLAPHLVKPLPVVVPLSRRLSESALAFRFALALYAALGGRGSWPGPESGLPAPGILERDAAPGLFQRGALWYDAQVTHAERLTLDFVLAASALGAEACTYLEASALRIEGGRVQGIEAVDLESGRSLAIEADAVLDLTGPWAGRLAPLPRPLTFALGWNVVLARTFVSTAVGFRSRRDGRYLFLAPWEGRTLLGTSYRTHAGGEVEIRRDDWIDLLQEANEAMPALRLEEADVVHVHAGLLPLEAGSGSPLADRPQIVDHGRAGGPRGIWTVVGVKYTTARAVAENAVIRLVRALGRGAVPAPGSGTLGHETIGAAAHPGRSAARLYALHGARWTFPAQEPGGDIPVHPDSPVLRAEVRHAVRAEMAIHLDDVVLRRTDLGTRGRPRPEVLGAVADSMASELGWDDKRRAAEVARVERAYRPLAGMGKAE
jgi:glycerol-3-phosphate dehydrogenase